MSDTGLVVDGPLLELFRGELETHAAALSQGLLALETETANGPVVETLMRAAHSIKGAGRVVGVELATRLAHALEDRFVTLREQHQQPAPEEIDLFLRAADLLGQLATATVSSAALAAFQIEHAPATDAMVQLLTSPAPPARASAAATVPVAAAPPPAPAPTTAVAPVPPAPAPAVAKAGVDRVVRVTATNIERLLGLAGESLVETRRLHPFADALRLVQEKQSALSRMLDEIEQKLREGANADALGALLANVRGRALECRQIVADRASDLDSSARRLEDATARLYREVLASRMRPFADGVAGFPRMVRDLARSLGKKVKLELVGEATQVDRDVLERLESPLTHILRNALDHGVEPPEERVGAGKAETSTIRLEARHRAGMLIITIGDDGRGIDLERLRRKIVDRGMVAPEMAARLSQAELMEFIFLPGVTTREQVTELSGRGVGLDVVQAFVQEIGGTVRAFTDLGRGTRFQLQLPLTLSVIRAVVVEIAGDPYALPLNRIERIVRVPVSLIRVLEGREFFPLDDQNIGLVPGSRVLAVDAKRMETDEIAVVVVGDRTYRYGLAVDRFLGEHDLVVRPLDPRLGRVTNVSAAAILNDGSPLLILDVDDVVRSIDKLLHSESAASMQLGAGPIAQKRRKRVLVVDDSITVREVERQLLTMRGYDVTLAVDGADGWNTLRAGTFDLVVSDVDMPRMNGIELTRTIKQDLKLRGLPVVIVSYKDREEDRIRGLEAGADAYLTKSSFQDETLLRAVEDLIGEAQT
jgi:two-component system sensor histidine kinase and response regulator WspE